MNRTGIPETVSVESRSLRLDFLTLVEGFDAQKAVALRASRYVDGAIGSTLQLGATPYSSRLSSMITDTSPVRRSAIELRRGQDPDALRRISLARFSSRLSSWVRFLL